MKHTGGIRLFEGAVAVVTGAASGIGEALAHALAERGSEVVLADIDVDLARRVADAVRARGAKAAAVELEVSDFVATKSVVEGTFNRCGRLDFMFNNAGIAVGGEIRDHSPDDWRRVIEVNLLGEINGVQAAYPLMVRQGFGHIINTASMQGLVPSPMSASYAATKAALISLSKSLRAEAAASGIRVSALCPGVIRTPLLRGGRHGRVALPKFQGREIDRAQMSALLEQLGAELFERLRPMDSAQFANRVLRQVARNRFIIIVPSWWKALWWIDRLSPPLSSFLLRRATETLRSSIQTKLSNAR